MPPRELWKMPIPGSTHAHINPRVKDKSSLWYNVTVEFLLAIFMRWKTFTFFGQLTTRRRNLRSLNVKSSEGSAAIRAVYGTVVWQNNITPIDMFEICLKCCAIKCVICLKCNSNSCAVKWCAWNAAQKEVCRRVPPAEQLLVGKMGFAKGWFRWRPLLGSNDSS